MRISDITLPLNAEEGGGIRFTMGKDVLVLANSSPVLKGAGIALVTFSLIKLFRSVWRYYKYFVFYNNIPGEKDFHWLLGNTHKLTKISAERMEYFNALMLKNTRIMRFWVGPFQPVIILHHPDTIKLVLKTSEPKPLGIFGTYKLGLPWLGEGLLLSGGDRWARSRRLLTPAFHFDILKPYVDIYNKATEILMKKIEWYAEKEESFELFSVISLCTFDIILQCAMSYDDDIQTKGESHPYVKAVGELSRIWFERGRNPLLYPDLIFRCTKKGRRFFEQCKFVHSISEDIIEKRKRTLIEKGVPEKRYLDFLDILLTARNEDGFGLTPLEIRNEVDTFLFEGDFSCTYTTVPTVEDLWADQCHDTTASATSWILYSMATNPDIQKDVQMELDAIFEHKDVDKIEWTDLPKLAYLTRVIKEGMRLHCPVPVIQRKLTQPLEVDGRTLPVGTSITISFNNLHHNPSVWEDPWEFRPDRFLLENIVQKDQFAFLPFSAGPRNCIGQNFAMNEEKVILARILHRFKFEIDPKHKVQKLIAAVMRAEEGIHVFAKSRAKGE